MPLYTVRDKTSGERHDVLMSYTDLKQLLADDRNLEQVLTGAPGIVGGVGDRNKAGTRFNDRMQQIANSHPNSPLAEKHRRRTAKEVKTSEVVKKHIGI